MSDLEMPEFFVTSLPKSNRSHKCCECKGVIEKGEQYVSIRGKWDGDVTTYKQCIDCSNLSKELDDVGLGEMITHVFESQDTGIIRQFLSIRAKRKAPESKGRWMETYLEENEV